MANAVSLVGSAKRVAATVIEGRDVDWASAIPAMGQTNTAPSKRAGRLMSRGRRHGHLIRRAGRGPDTVYSYLPDAAP
jgi:hypothetical protein